MNEGHWHIAFGLAGYGPDGADGFGCADTLTQAAEAAREELDRAADQCEDFAHAAADAGDFEAAWREHMRSLDLETLRANLDPARASAPFYNGRPDLWHETLLGLMRESFPVDVGNHERLYVWECDHPEDCDQCEDGDTSDPHSVRMLDGGDATFGRTDDGYEDPRGYA